MPALRITDLTETEADLIEAFVHVVVEEAGGFANFRETATKTNSLIIGFEPSLFRLSRACAMGFPAIKKQESGLMSWRRRLNGPTSL